MGSKYEIRYYNTNNYVYYSTEEDYTTTYTNNWFKYIWLRLTKNVIYYKVVII